MVDTLRAAIAQLAKIRDIVQQHQLAVDGGIRSLASISWGERIYYNSMEPPRV
jgi:hypothetical protein